MIEDIDWSDWDDDPDIIAEFASHVVEQADMEQVAQIVNATITAINALERRNNATVHLALATLMAEMVNKTPSHIPRIVILKIIVHLAWNYSLQSLEEDDEP